MIKLKAMSEGAPTGKYSKTPLSEIVPLLVDRTLRDVAREYDISPGALWGRLNAAGYTVASIREKARQKVDDGLTVRQRIREREGVRG
jgi:hypothetical protein